MSIPILRHDELASTSSFAKERLRDGNLTPPFAILAQSQSAGRGRLGTEWQSPRGNLYLSVALPLAWVEKQSLTRIPFLTGYLIAQWIEDLWGITVRLKWPNDILFAGKKLGGILSEGIFAGDELKSVVVGIGLNLNQDPGIGHSTTLKNILGSKLNVDECATTLVDWIAANWNLASLQAATELFERYAVGQRHPWIIGPEAEVKTQKAILPDGTLVLERARRSEEVTSVDKGVHWGFHDQQNLPLFVADIGNSNVKVACYMQSRQSGKPDVAKWQNDKLKIADLRELATVHPELKQGMPIFFVSVNDAVTSELRKLAQETGLILEQLTAKRVRLMMPHYDTAQIGLDRLALMEGVLNRRVDSFIAVSCGTATTIDTVTKRKHMGGFILAGLQTKLTALYERTGKLPAIDLGSNLPTVSREYPDGTRDAMIVGAIRETASFISELQRELSAGEPGCERMPIFLTGGAGEILLPYLQEAVYLPNLILEGVRSMVLGGVDNNPDVGI